MTNALYANRTSPSGRFAPLSLPKDRRVLRSAEFRHIYQTGIRMTSRYFAAFCLQSGDADCMSRFGFTTPRALGKAVQRNRVKRRMRAAVSHHIDVISGCWSIVFNPRRNVLDASFEDLCQEVERLFARCKQS